MNMEADTTPVAQVMTPHRRFIRIVLIFVLLGPLFAALVAALGLGIVAAVTESASLWTVDIIGYLLASVVVLPLFSIPFAYLFGLLPALVIGLGAAMGDRRAGTVPMRPVLGLSAALWAVFSVILLLSEGVHRGAVIWVVLMLITVLICAALCVRVARWWVAPARQA